MSILRNLRSWKSPLNVKNFAELLAPARLVCDCAEAFMRGLNGFKYHCNVGLIGYSFL